MPPTSNLRSPFPSPGPHGSGPSAPLPPASPTTLRSAASESLPYAPMAAAGKRARWPFVAAGIGVVGLAGALIAVVLMRSSHSSDSHAREPVAASSSNDAGVVTMQPPASRAPQDASITTTSPAASIPANARGNAIVVGSRLDAGVVPAVLDAGRTEVGSPVATGTRPDAGGRTSTRERTAPTAMGRAEISARPWATVTVDGKLYGEAPQDLTLSVGRHKLTLTSGAKHKTMIINITKEKTVEIDEDAGTW